MVERYHKECMEREEDMKKIEKAGSKAEKEWRKIWAAKREEGRRAKKERQEMEGRLKPAEKKGWEEEEKMNKKQQLEKQQSDGKLA